MVGEIRVYRKDHPNQIILTARRRQSVIIKKKALGLERITAETTLSRQKILF